MVSRRVLSAKEKLKDGGMPLQAERWQRGLGRLVQEAFWSGSAHRCTWSSYVVNRSARIELCQLKRGRPGKVATEAGASRDDAASLRAEGGDRNKPAARRSEGGWTPTGFACSTEPDERWVFRLLGIAVQSYRYRSRRSSAGQRNRLLVQTEIRHKTLQARVFIFQRSKP